MDKLRQIIKEQLEKGLILEKSNFISQLENIAKKYLGIKTLKTQKSDSLDFHEVAVWQVKSALKAAYKEGKSSQNEVETLNEDSFVIDDYLISIQDYINKRLKKLKDDKEGLEELKFKLKDWISGL